jgi:hypothetical protein
MAGKLLHSNAKAGQVDGPRMGYPGGSRTKQILLAKGNFVCRYCSAKVQRSAARDWLGANWLAARNGRRRISGTEAGAHRSADPGDLLITAEQGRLGYSTPVALCRQLAMALAAVSAVVGQLLAIERYLPARRTLTFVDIGSLVCATGRRALPWASMYT